MNSVPIKLGYFGSSDFSARFLEVIIQDNDLQKNVKLEFVVTQPDRPAGRKQIITPTPVKIIATKYNIPVFDNLESKIQDSKLRHIDIALLYAFSSLIPKKNLTIPKYGFWCVHPSLLPLYRGTSPMATALINGDKETGVTIIKMDEQIDHGPIIAQEKLTIENNDLRPDLERKLTDLSFQMFKKMIYQLTSSKIQKLKAIEQDHKKTTFTKKLSKHDGFIEFQKLKDFIKPTTNHLSQITVYNLYRGLYPWPGIWTLLRQGSGGQAKRLKITEMKIENGKLKIAKVQLEGKKVVDFNTFKKYYSFLLTSNFD